MRKNVIIAVAIAAILLCAGVAVLFFGGDNSKKNPYGAIDSKLQIRGNVNEDYTIDQDDMNLLEEVIVGDKKLDDYPLADVNGDGVVDNVDKTLLQDLIDRKDGTNVYVMCYDINSKPTTTNVTYPLDNVVPVGTDMMMIMWAGGQSRVAGYFLNNYPGMQDVPNATELGKSIRISDASWKNFLTLDASLKDGVGAIVLNTAFSKFLSPYSNDISTAGIPLIGFPGLDAESEIAAILTLGFLFGGDAEKTSLEYAKMGWNVVKEVKDKTSKLADSEKKSFITFCMTNYICMNGSTHNGAAISAGGIHYSKIDSAYASTYSGTGSVQMGSTEALSNYHADNLINVTSQDLRSSQTEKTSSMVTIWESAMPYYINYPAYEDVVYINLTMPDACRIAYIAHAMYPDLFSLEWADGVMQSYIDAGFEPLKGQTIKDNIITMISYQDYVNAKK